MCYDPAREELETEHNARFDYIAELREEHRDHVAEAGGDDTPEGYIADPEAARDFILGGNATFTVVSTKTGTRYTYRVRVAKDNPRTFFVSSLVGSNNEDDYAYVGFFKSIPGEGSRGVHTFMAKARDKDRGLVMIAGKKGNADDVRFRALDWLLQSLILGRMPRTVEFWHEGRCARCNRKLTDPESIARGFGPECAGKV
jgi:hypothetical protein